MECDGNAGYDIAEFVDGKRHGHEVRYGPAGDVEWEWDLLLNKMQYQYL